MKRFSIWMMSLLLATSCWAATDRVVTAEQLPEKAKKMLEAHFPGDGVQFASLDDDWFGALYEVHLFSGCEIEFTKEGEWMTIDSAPNLVPEALIPAPLLKEVQERFAGNGVVKIDRDRRGYELELSNGMELKFNSKYQLVELDD